MTSILLIATLLAPPLSALALALPRWRDRIVGLAPLVALPALLLASVGQTGSAMALPWLLNATLLELDSIALVFLAFTSALWFAAAWYARAYLIHDTHKVRFFLFFFIAMGGNFGVIVAGDVATFFACFALMSFASAGLVLHRGGQESLRAARVYVALAMVGEVILFSGLAFLAVAADSLRLSDLRQTAVNPVALVLVLAGFGIKAGALSLHFWLPLAHPAAPVPASAVLSGAMIKVGLLGWLRFLPLGFTALPEFGFVIIALGLGAAFMGTFVGVVQTNPKAVLAYSSISQMGIITVGLGIGLVRPQEWPAILSALLVYATHHGLAKGALFLSIGPAQAAASARAVFWTRLGLIVPALALAGAPFTSGAIAKTALKSTVTFLPETWATWVSIFLPLAAVGTTLKMARYLWLVWPREHAPQPDRSTGVIPPWIFLLLAVLFGEWFLPSSFESRAIEISLAQIWLGLWPVLVGGALAYLSFLLRHHLPTRASGAIPAGDVIVLIERLLKRLRRDKTKPEPIRQAKILFELNYWLPPLADGLLAMERSLRSWRNVGVALMLLILGLSLLLAAGS